MKASKVTHIVTGSNGKRKSSEMKNGNIKSFFRHPHKAGNGKKGKESGGGDEDSKPVSKKKKAADTLEYNPLYSSWLFLKYALLMGADAAFCFRTSSSTPYSRFLCVNTNDRA